MTKLIIASLVFSFLSISFANIGSTKTALSADSTQLLDKFKIEYKTDKEMKSLKDMTLAKSGKAVPVLIEVMKNSTYPDKNRWMATFLLGQIMGDKSAPFIAKFTDHPNWVMRMASLKTLLVLKQEQYGSVYSKMLSDKAFLVRVQALENIRTLKMEGQAPYVWAMLYDKQNYYSGANNGATKRTNIIKDVIGTIGDLKFKQATSPLLTMVMKDKYNDIFDDIDKALEKITDKKSPEGNKSVKRNFWQRFHTSVKTI